MAALVSLSSTVRADDTTAAEGSSVALAERRAAEAFAAYARKEYAAAVALYLEAYEAAPSGPILYNIARIYDTKLGDRPLAMTFYRRYVADPGAQADLIETANQRLHELHNAELTAGRATEDSSKRAGVADPYGRAAWSTPAERDSSPPAPRQGWSTLRWTGVALGAVGVAGLALGGGFGWAAMSKADTASGLCEGNACVSQSGVDAARAARTDASYSTIGFGLGGALLATGAALFYLGGDRGTARSDVADVTEGKGVANANGADVHLRAWATSSETSVQIAGRW